jgi:hypothetical protein
MKQNTTVLTIRCDYYKATQRTGWSYDLFLKRWHILKMTIPELIVKIPETQPSSGDCWWCLASAAHRGLVEGRQAVLARLEVVPVGPLQLPIHAPTRVLTREPLLCGHHRHHYHQYFPHHFYHCFLHHRSRCQSCHPSLQLRLVV